MSDSFNLPRVPQSVQQAVSASNAVDRLRLLVGLRDAGSSMQLPEIDRRPAEELELELEQRRTTESRVRRARARLAARDRFLVSGAGGVADLSPQDSLASSLSSPGLSQGWGGSGIQGGIQQNRTYEQQRRYYEQVFGLSSRFSNIPVRETQAQDVEASVGSFLMTMGFTRPYGGAPGGGGAAQRGGLTEEDFEALPEVGLEVGVRGMTADCAVCLHPLLHPPPEPAVDATDPALPSCSTSPPAAADGPSTGGPATDPHMNTIKLLRCCRSSFHAACLRGWLLRIPTCPLCRAPAPRKPPR